MRLAHWIVNHWVPRAWRESVMGDLEEERAKRRHAGLTAGGWWATRAALTLAVRFAVAVDASGATDRQSSWAGGLMTDVRMALRSLRATPAFTAGAITVLALGIGATAAVFSVVDVALLRPLPYPEPDRLVVIGENDTVRPNGIPGFVGSAASQNYREWEARQTSFAALTAIQNTNLFIARDGAEPEALRALKVTSSFFDVLRVPVIVGQAFTRHHEQPGQNRVIVIGHDVWVRRFGADPNVVGRRMSFDSGSFEILGVLPPGFRFPAQAAQPTDVLTPLERTAQQLVRDRTKVGRNYSWRVVGRLKDDVSLSQARAEFEGIAAGLVAAYPDWFEDMTLAMESLHTTVVGRTRDWMVMLMGAVACVLLIACANVANLVLARASSRTRELHVRTALGASRWRLIRSALVESLLLSGAGLAAAMLVASWGLSVLRASIPASVPRIAELALDVRVMSFAALVTIVTAVVCGLLPVWHLTAGGRLAALRDQDRGGTASRGRVRVRAALVAAEIGLAVMLVVGAGLFVASFHRVTSVDLGIDIRNVVTVNVNPRRDPANPNNLDAARDRGIVLIDQVMTRLASRPGVEAVAAVGSGSPLSGSWRTNTLSLAGETPLQGPEHEVQIKEVTPGYRDVFRVPVRLGRYIDASDSAVAQPVIVLNEEAVRRHFDGKNPIGATVRLENVDRVVIGVVGDVRVLGPEEPIAPEAYLPLAQRPGIGGTVLVRVASDPESWLPEVRSHVLAAEPGVPVTAATMESTLRGLTAQRRFNMVLVTVFGVLALTIAGVGIYGVMAFTVTQQTREIGVRMALGAVPASVLRHVLKRAGTYVAAGVTGGLIGAWLLAGSVESFLFDVRAHDPLVFLLSAAVLAATGLMAALVPALRAARVDPVIALRAQ